ncbi:TIGR03086 family metal-binding protein [Streptomyces sp. NPDC097610]|uniref:TIGR03086 family metal-binding protein n=1 Tax=Streptomyces sp. NPDC097610 TaxID=3157227 RepID=UPI00331A0EE5
MSQAVRFASYGDADVLKLVDVPLPEPGEGQVRVAVKAVGVNPIDWKIRQGLFSSGQALAEPTRVGTELSGVIDAVGSGVTGWRIGQAVFGRSANYTAAAEYDVVDAADLIAKPEWLSFEQAAALPAAVETAYRTLRELKVGMGDTLLVHAAAGGVGLVATQLARAWGATVIGTASAPNHAFLQEVGAVPVSYGDGLVERVRAAAPQGIDAVLDASGRGVLPDSIELTGDPNKVLTIADLSGAALGVRFSGTPLSVVEALAAVLPLMEKGQLQMPIDSVFPLQRTADAQRRSEQGHLRGKIIIKVAPASSLLAAAAAPTVQIIRHITSDQLDATTPDSEWTVRQLLHHLLHWAPVLEGAARKEAVAADPAADLVRDDWAVRLEAHIDRLVRAWGNQSAWEGTVPLGGHELPALVVGGVMLNEWVVHGWDLARATGQTAEWPDDALEYLYHHLSKSVERGRAEGMFGAEVAVPTEASAMDRLLGLSGRDPQWTP